MHLYALKNGKDYLRLDASGTFQPVALDRASVFPPDKYALLLEHLAKAKESGLTNARLIQLLVTENESWVQPTL